MFHKTTISSVDFLSDCVLEEGATVFVEDSGKVFHCVLGFGGQLTWEQKAKRHFDFPEAQSQLQEIEFEAPRSEGVQSREVPKLKLRLKKVHPRYLH